VEHKNKCDTSNDRGNWNHLKIIHKIPQQRTGKPQSQGATENSHIGHCTRTAESTNVKVQ
jgi:ribosomal protein L14E/L6E/L27E